MAFAAQKSDKKIRTIAVVADRLCPARGGAEAHLFQLIDRLARHGYCVEAHTRVSRPLSRRIQSRLLDSVLSIEPIPEATHYIPPVGLYRAVFEAEREALNSKIRKGLYRPAMQFNIRRQLLMRRQRQLLSAKPAPQVLTHSYRIKTQIESQLGPREITVLPHGVDLCRFHPDPVIRKQCRERFVKAGELFLLFVAHNFLLKGLHNVFEALASDQSLASRARLIIAGGGPVKAFQRLAKKEGISARVSFLGALGPDALIPLYQGADVLVHPTFYDHFSLVALEALGCGCPVVTTERNGASEIIESGKQGFIIDQPRNVRALREAVTVCCDPVRQAAMSREAIRLARRFDIETYVQKFVRWLNVR